MLNVSIKNIIYHGTYKIDYPFAFHVRYDETVFAEVVHKIEWLDNIPTDKAQAEFEIVEYWEHMNPIDEDYFT